MTPSHPDTSESARPDPDAGWIGLLKAGSVVFAPLLVLVASVAVATMLWPHPPSLGPILSRMLASGMDPDSLGISGHDERAVSDASEADSRRLEFAMQRAGDQSINRTGLRAVHDTVSWSTVETLAETEMQTLGLRRDTTFRPFPSVSLSRAARWAYRDWLGNQRVFVLALVDTPRPSTGERVRFLVQAWTERED